MAQKLIRHGSNAGYRAELAANGNACPRCHKAHLVYQTQYSRSAKAAGIKYAGAEVIDHLYQASTEPKPGRTPTRARTAVSQPEPGITPPPELPEPEPYGATGDGSGASLGERLGARLRDMVIPEGDSPYVPEDVPDYLTPVDPDPEPGGEWSDATDEEYVINAAGMRKIEDNLGTYLSIVGMTAEMIDPYCGAIAAENFDNMVSKWSRVIAHYPAAAKLFLDSKGGVVFTWIAALQATWPVLYAFYEHHLSKTVEVKNGQIIRKVKNGINPDSVDATMPPMAPDYTFSAT
jgi:hypothetical protein